MKKIGKKKTYIGIPHKFKITNLGDPVFKRHVQRVMDFYKSSFWANLHAYECHQAAFALAKRGLNIDEMFFYWGPGGVGLTLTTVHLENMAGRSNHKMFDPQMFYLDEEMRKQIENIADAFMWTACEKPEGMKSTFREDLYKKVMSADGIFARLPYQIITKVIHMIGWKRMELNKLIKFTNVKESGFQALFRRALLIKMYARFVDEEYVKNHLPEGKK